MDINSDNWHFYDQGAYQDEDGYMRNHATNRLIHRDIAESKIGRKLKFWEVVHHIDFNKLNNDPKNLFVCSQKFHELIHELKIRKENFWKFVYKIKAEKCY